MSHQITKLDLIPNGEIITCNSSQFDNGRVLPFEIYENKEAYNIPNDVRVELHCRKPDGNIVTIPSDTITDNIVTFITTTQLTACYGDNVCEIALYGADDYLIGSANFILEVEKSPTLGGINSTTEIHNLEEQIENITTEIIGENYYTKSETDTKLALKANAADVYTKSETDTKLALKANAADVYTKSQVDNIIMDIMPVGTASGPIATFNTELAVPLVNVSCNIVATGGNGTPDNPNPIVGYSSANITRCGVNLWDEEWELGVFNVDTGEPATATNRIRAKNYIQIKPNTSYYFIAKYSTNDMFLQQYYYDENYNYLGRSRSGSYSPTSTNNPNYENPFTTPANAYYMRFVVSPSYGTSYRNDISINYPATDTNYHAYNGNTYTIAFGQTVYGGVLDVTRGKLKPCIEYPSYNGETLSGRWLSSEATYVEGTTPPTGSQVVSLDDYGTDIDLTPVQISALVGTNNIFVDTNGNTTVKFKDTIQNYIDKKVSI